MSERVATAGRLVSIDLARFFAIAAMFLAHVAPSRGPYGVLNLSEFLAAPLFAALLGVSTFLSSERMAKPMLFASSVVRGIILVALGQWMDSWGAAIDIVLQVLGLLSIFCALLVLLPSWALVLVALASWFLTIPVSTYFTQLVPTASLKNEYLGLATIWMFTGGHYRVFTMLCWAAVGIILIKLMRQWGVAGDIAGFLVSTTAALAIFWYTRVDSSLLVYSGDRLEIGFNALLCISAVTLSSLLARIFAGRDGALAPFLLMGRMSLSLYVLQIGVLAIYAHNSQAWGLPVSDDSWWMLALLFMLSFAFVLLWNRFLGRTALRRGPLESVLAWTTGRG